MTDIRDIVLNGRDGLKSFDERMEPKGQPPKEGSEEVVPYVKRLFEDAKKWRKRSLLGRFEFGDKKYDDPIAFFKVLKQLEQGMHWKVWGRRNTSAGDEWKQELVDNEIGNQVRVRKSYLTANWHDVSITPNVNNISEIIDQERHDTGWGKLITASVMRALVQGTALVRTIFDRSERPEGLARDVLLENASLFPAPYSTGVEALEGCWYFCIGSMIPKHKAIFRYPHLNLVEVSNVSKEIRDELTIDPENGPGETFKETSLVDMYEFYIDDFTLENIPSNKEMIDLEHQAIMSGTGISVDEDDDDRDHVESHLSFMESIDKQEVDVSGMPEEAQEAIVQYMIQHVAEHMAQLKSKLDAGLTVGKQRKYPFGRYIVVVGDQLAEDVPNPLHRDWHKLLTKYDNEATDGFWGRGVPEILWDTNRNEDTMLSRTADLALFSIPKKHYSAENMQNYEKPEFGLNDNNPLKPAFVLGQPYFPAPAHNPDHIALYQMHKSDAQKQLGVTDVSYGESPGAQVSGRLVEILLSQNQVIVTGEANQNLGLVVEQLLENRIELYRQLYTEPRFWFVNGIPRAIILSDRLSRMTVVNEEGQQEEIEVPRFQVFVRPNSNMPKQFEFTLAMLTQLMAVQSPDGEPFVTREMVLDLLAERYPQYGRTGPYYREAQATLIGRQVLEEQALKQQREDGLVKQAADRIQGRAVKTATEGGRNGILQEAGRGAKGTGPGAEGRGA